MVMTAICVAPRVNVAEKAIKFMKFVDCCQRQVGVAGKIPYGIIEVDPHIFNTREVESICFSFHKMEKQSLPETNRRDRGTGLFVLLFLQPG